MMGQNMCYLISKSQLMKRMLNDNDYDDNDDRLNMMMINSNGLTILLDLFGWYSIVPSNILFRLHEYKFSLRFSLLKRFPVLWIFISNYISCDENSEFFSCYLICNYI